VLAGLPARDLAYALSPQSCAARDVVSEDRSWRGGRLRERGRPGQVIAAPGIGDLAVMRRFSAATRGSARDFLGGFHRLADAGAHFIDVHDRGEGDFCPQPDEERFGRRRYVA
jgi:hypothetical protein